MTKKSATAASIALLALTALTACEDEGESFPFESLVVENGTLHTTVDFNPYSNYPPRLRWKIGVNFKEIQPPGAGKPDTTFISYTVDLGEVRDWKSLAGKYSLDSQDGSDMWIDGTNYGLVELQKLTIKPAGKAVYDISLDLLFNFDGTPFKPEKRIVTFQSTYEGLTFFAPLWTNPKEVEFPPSWDIPTSKPHWTDAQAREFVSRYMDLSQFGQISIDQSGEYTTLEAKP